MNDILMHKIASNKKDKHRPGCGHIQIYSNSNYQIRNLKLKSKRTKFGYVPNSVLLIINGYST